MITPPKFFCWICGVLLVLFFSGILLTAGAPEAQAQRVGDLQTVTVDASSRAASPTDAVKEAAAWATMQTAREQIIEILGQPAYDKNKAVISQKIMKQTTRFIPMVTPGQPIEQKDKSWKVPVELKVSQNSLRKLLVDEGIMGLAASETAINSASILPVIGFIDRTKTQSMRWWMGDEKQPELKFLVSLEALMHQKLSEEIAKQNLVFVKPADGSLVPQNLQIEHPSAQDLSAIGAYFKSAMLARGDVRVVPSDTAGAATITVKIQVVQAAAPDRVIAEVVRDFTSDPHAPSLEAGLRTKANLEFSALAKDLSAQVQQAWQRGTVGTNFINLAVRGSLNPQQQTAFKTAFIRTVHEVRELKERIFERDLVTYEADYSGDAASFANRLRALRLAGFDMKVSGDGDRTITLDVKPNNQVN